MVCPASHFQGNWNTEVSVQWRWPLHVVIQLPLSIKPKHKSMLYANENEQSTEITTWMDLTTSKLSERSQEEHKSRPPVWFYANKGQKQARRIAAFRSQVSGCPGTGHRVLCAGYWLCQKSLSGILMIYLKIFFVYSGCAGALVLRRGLFSSCSEWGLLSGCSMWVSHGSGFSFCRAQALGCWLNNCGAQA